jgi:hypothetical protein
MEEARHTTERRLVEAGLAVGAHLDPLIRRMRLIPDALSAIVVRAGSPVDSWRAHVVGESIARQYRDPLEGAWLFEGLGGTRVSPRTRTRFSSPLAPVASSG